MKRIYLLLIIGIILFPTIVKADTIYDLDMKVNITKEGTAEVVEVWDVQADSGSEWYKQYKSLKNIELTDFTVDMDGIPLTKKTWNVNEGINEKARYYGINYISGGLELCFGKTDYDKHKFTLRYKLSDFVFNISDAQAVYFTLFPNVKANDFSVTITSYYEFPNTLDVWGYGYKGYAYVKDGKIEMSNEENTSLNGDYVVLLAKFPEKTFETTNSYPDFIVFDDVLTKAKEGSYKYNYDTSTGNSADYGIIIKTILLIMSPYIFIVLIYIIIYIVNVIRYKTGNYFTENKEKYGYINNKKIDKKNIPLFREIPCNKDIYMANALIRLNKFGYKKTNIIGAIILKMLMEKKIEIRKEPKKFNKNAISIILKEGVVFNDEVEEYLFKLMTYAGENGVVKQKQLKKYCKKNFPGFLKLFFKVDMHGVEKLRTEKHIYIRQNKKECRHKYVMDDYIYEESKKLYGLNKFFNEFTIMGDKETFDVHLLNEYLMFAYLFGSAKKVAEQLKKHYPTEFDIIKAELFDDDILSSINRLSVITYNGAMNSQIRSSIPSYSSDSSSSRSGSYSSGGGGGSSGGGGGGSFGGGGSMGGR